MTINKLFWCDVFADISIDYIQKVLFVVLIWLVLYIYIYLVVLSYRLEGVVFILTICMAVSLPTFKINVYLFLKSHVYIHMYVM